MTSVTDIWGLQPALDGKAPKRHNHKVSDIDGLKDALLSIQNAIFEGQATEPILISSIQGLSNALDGKAPVNHGHTIDQITGLTNALNALAEGIGEKAAASHSHGNATTSTAGFMSAADKAKLDGLSQGGGASTIAQVEGLQAALDGKASTAHTHTGLINLSPTLLTYTISQSSNYAAAPQTGTYSNLTDNTLTNGAGTDQSTPGGEWVKADLGAIRTFNRIILAGGNLSGWGTSAQYLNGASIEVSDNDTDWGILLPAISRVSDTTQTMFCWGPIVARYVRVWRSGYIGLSTLKIYG